MSRLARLLSVCVPVVLSAFLLAQLFAAEYKSGKVWPEPKVVTPGENNSPPSDAIVLFDGKDLSHWQASAGGAAKWPVKEGAAIVRGGDIRTLDSFGPDYQLHV